MASLAWLYFQRWCCSGHACNEMIIDNGYVNVTFRRYMHVSFVFIRPECNISSVFCGGTIFISLIMVGKNTWWYLVTSWQNKDTHIIIPSIYGFYFHKLIFHSFSGLLKLFLIILTKKGFILNSKHIHNIQAADNLNQTKTVMRNWSDEEITSTYINVYELKDNK